MTKIICSSHSCLFFSPFLLIKPTNCIEARSIARLYMHELFITKFCNFLLELLVPCFFDTVRCTKNVVMDRVQIHLVLRGEYVWRNSILIRFIGSVGRHQCSVFLHYCALLVRHLGWFQKWTIQLFRCVITCGRKRWVFLSECSMGNYARKFHPNLFSMSCGEERAIVK